VSQRITTAADPEDGAVPENVADQAGNQAARADAKSGPVEAAIEREDRVRRRAGPRTSGPVDRGAPQASQDWGKSTQQR
jgi:hypothetical protein